MKNKVINLRVTDFDKDVIASKSKQYGFHNISEYLRFVGINAIIEVKMEEYALRNIQNNKQS